MKTKTIPFDLEMAKKIQAGEIEGRIKSIDGQEIKTIIQINGAKTYNNEQLSFVEYVNGKKDFIFFKRLFIELPEEAPKYKFQPFDKVLVRSKNETNNKWFPAIYAYYDDVVSHITIDHKMYGDCIPYEGNEHLVGTTDKPKEE